MRVESTTATRKAFNDLHISSMPTVVVVRRPRASSHNEVFLLTNPKVEEVIDALEFGRGMQLGRGAFLQQADDGLDDEWDELL